ncbi:hypothetical protein TMatcc_002972 [Talaromyces marneffei ATCC 18224]|uniref:4-hydroxybenzoate polyprenyl transferase, putative n=2 Tax=Talaromyces marneffei TaxID=37727 RepID=B6Q6S2_TALMQ|nr:uncharacterized protein EYB26_001952 [Talaromyces marneffei]EEA28677.1 4-hydroxybenzoate polyprenyl transferase, putative [Talaromyces marneffei ATCC 18224]KAE8555705.1 hypothetical protein EYB25_000403 [Talaromyces marneffei]QGA14299.1 hypothetical protein EYB26_001952 [Talaromyces marneffei]
MTVQPSSSATRYSQPKNGLLSLLPSSWVPFMELMRLDRPQGYYAFYWHYLIGLSFAACGVSDSLSPSELLVLAAYLGLWVLVLRGSVCTVNDICDQDFDRQVARTRFRPLARREISTTQATVFTIAQLFVLTLLTLPLPTSSYPFAAVTTLALSAYPLGKRITHFPQVILGLAFAIPIFMCCVILDRPTDAGDRSSRAVFALYWVSTFWTIISDTIYAHQDMSDDAKAGVKSLAVFLGNQTKLWLAVLAIIQVALLVFIGAECDFSFLYYTLCCAGTALSLGAMLLTVDLQQPASCAWWFGPGARLVGCSLVGGFLAEYVYRRGGL